METSGVENIFKYHPASRVVSCDYYKPIDIDGMRAHLATRRSCHSVSDSLDSDSESDEEASESDAVRDTHREAHGLMPDRIFEVIQGE